MKKFLVLSLLALVVMTMSSCMHVKVNDKNWSLGGNHRNDTPTQVHQVGQETAMQPFDKVNAAGPFNVILEQGDANRVRVEGTAQQLEKMTIYVKDGELYVDQRESKWNGNDFQGLQVFVTTPSIKGIEIAGSGTVTAPKTLTAGDIGLEVAGSGDITLAQLTCRELSIQIAGSGSVTTGAVQAGNVKTEIAGSGDISIAALTCQRLHNEIAGSGDMLFNNVNIDIVETNIAGSGDVIIHGKVGSHHEDIAGSGKVHINEK